jgi:hypothetical protein
MLAKDGNGMPTGEAGAPSKAGGAAGRIANREPWRRPEH